MICLTDQSQMHQVENIGGGFQSSTRYMTWELKECPDCGMRAIEFYTAFEVPEVVNPAEVAAQLASVIHLTVSEE